MKRDEMAQIIVVMGKVWPNMRIPESTAEAALMRDAWFRVLGDFESDVVMASVDWFSNEAREFPPNPGQLADRVRSMLDPLDVVPDVDQALVEIRAAIGACGRSGSPSWSHPAIAAAVASIGWRNLCDSTNQDVLRAQIIRVYGTSSERHRRTQAIPPSVRGVLESVASTLGLERGA